MIECVLNKLLNRQYSSVCMSVALFKYDEKIPLRFICAISGFFKTAILISVCGKGYIRSNGTFDLNENVYASRIWKCG